MELNELKLIWQAYDDKLEKSLKLNLRCLAMIQAQKVKSKLKPYLWGRVIEAFIHIIVILWLCGFLFEHFFEVHFSFSAFVLILFFLVAFLNSVKQVILINQINYTEDILTIQKKITLLQSHFLDYIRLTFLCIPTYLAYPVVAFKTFGNFDLTGISHNWWTAQLAFTMILIPVCVWLYKQVSYKNIHKKWVKNIIEKSGGNSLRRAMEFTKEIDEIKHESI